jgi:hypothetical protein
MHTMRKKTNHRYAASAARRSCAEQNEKTLDKSIAANDNELVLANVRAALS